jgi:hypothetical protein
MSEVIKFSVVDDIVETNKICKELMGTPHYKKLGEAGMRLIVEKAKSMGMHPVEALNGGLYNVSGKIEMTGQSMLSMIRQAGHSVTKDQKSTSTSVILHGKRKDTGDTWTSCFSIEDAKKAGIYRNMWEKYPEVMCTWRCVSMLGRFLFSDILKGVYVEGEISESKASDDLKVVNDSLEVEVKEIPTITFDQFNELNFYLDSLPVLKENLMTYMKEKYSVSDLSNMPVVMFKSSLSRAKEHYEARNNESVEVTNEA